MKWPPRPPGWPRAWLLAALLVAGAVPAVAEQPPPETEPLGELDLEGLMDLRIDRVHGASRYEQKVTRAPAAVTVISADEIRRLGHRTLADALRGITGVYVTYDRNYSNLGVRGFGRPGDFNTRVLLLIDGHRMNDNLYGSALIGPEAIVDIDLVERIELIRGPSSSIYGNSAFFGVINVITRKGERLAQPEVSLTAGSERTLGGRASFGAAVQGVELTLSGSTFGSDGQDALYFREFDDSGSDGFARGSDGEDAHQLLASAAWKGWRLAAAWSRRDKDIPTASFGTVFDDGREQSTDRRWFVDLRRSAGLGENTQLATRVFYDRYDYYADYPYDFAAPGDPASVVVTHDDNYGTGAGAELQLTQVLQQGHTLVLGAEYRHDLGQYQSNYSGDPRTYSFQDRRSGGSSGLYGQAEWVLDRRWLVNAGLRYDHFRTFGGKLSPRVGVIFQPAPATAGKLLYGVAYRAPNAFELYQASPGFSRANPGLRPETIRTYEAVVEQYFGPIGLGLSLYRYDLRDLISQVADEDGLLVFENQPRIRARGAELSAEAVLKSGVRARGSFAWQSARDTAGRQLSNSPRRLSRASLVAPLWRRLAHAGLELQHASEAIGMGGDVVPGRTVLNATLLRERAWRSLDLAFSVHNALDREYSDPASTSHRQVAIPQDGRSVRLEATVRF